MNVSGSGSGNDKKSVFLQKYKSLSSHMSNSSMNRRNNHSQLYKFNNKTNSKQLSIHGNPNIFQNPNTSTNYQMLSQNINQNFNLNRISNSLNSLNSLDIIKYAIVYDPYC